MDFRRGIDFRELSPWQYRRFVKVEDVKIDFTTVFTHFYPAKRKTYVTFLKCQLEFRKIQYFEGFSRRILFEIETTTNFPIKKISVTLEWKRINFESKCQVNMVYKSIPKLTLQQYN